MESKKVLSAQKFFSVKPHSRAKLENVAINPPSQKLMSVGNRRKGLRASADALDEEVPLGPFCFFEAETATLELPRVFVRVNRWWVVLVERTRDQCSGVVVREKDG
ncbi:hypothetical protein GOBAR_AA24329 [Gossypium barbadense]|uniref:Uncharacterized protein n=1 Tax=Gossypium barbadense TaxID=3634 RepID=A0A2P5WZ32_GOSBA|nr:hypothetical protein GOBAR_AA24329 [Gossypium barbadense]